MNKDAIRHGLSTSLKLTKYLSSRGSSKLPPMISPFGGKVPHWTKGSEKIQQSMAAKNEGTLGQFVAAKRNPTDLRTQHSPHFTADRTPPVMDAKVERGTGMTRDALVEKPASAVRALFHKTASPGLLSLQSGMNNVRALMWKHMSKGTKANRSMQKMLEERAAQV